MGHRRPGVQPRHSWKCLLLEGKNLIEFVQPDNGGKPVPWPGLPTSTVSGFVAAAVNIKLVAGYSLVENGVVGLHCFEVIGNQQPTLWRSHLTPSISALEMAEDMCAYIEAYIDDLRLVRRPSEDLDLDDFLHHLDMRINNGLH